MPQIPQTPRVICSGILVADLFVPLLPSLPSAGELRATEEFLLDSGGCAANVATCLARLGISPEVRGCVGQDVFADFILSDLRSKGVEISGIRRTKGHRTSQTVILPVAGEDRRFIHTFGANHDFNGEDMATDSLEAGNALYLGGFLILPGLQAAAVARRFQEAQQRGIRTILDIVVPVGENKGAMEALQQVLPYTDYFLPNVQEAKALTGLDHPRDHAICFLEMGCSTVIITCGEQGSLVLDARTCLQAPAYPVEFVDGSGAGDAFAAGWIAGVLEGWDIRRTLKFAGAIGASACSRLGCTTGVFNRVAAEAFVEGNPLLILEHESEDAR